jgi:paraquat-inducible protein B
VIQRSNPRVIGGFVVGALALAAGAVLVFGSGEVFRKYERAVIFFQGSVGGLRVGAPVDFRGVQIGTVRDISIQYDVRSGQSAIPVVIDIDPTRVKAVGRSEDGDSGFPIERMVERGLRAELRLQSFVTGQMAVQLNFHARNEAYRVGSNLPYPEIPTVPSTFEQAQEFLTELAAQAPPLIGRLNHVLDQASDVLGQFGASAPDARAALGDIAKFSKALGDSDQDIRNTLGALSKLTADLGRLSQHADAATLEFGDTAKRLNRLLGESDGPIKTLLVQFNKVGAGLVQVTDQLNLILQDNREGLKDFSSSGLYDLTNLIRDTQDLVGNLNRTIDDLRRNPSQFLFGQQQREIPTSRAK